MGVECSQQHSHPRVVMVTAGSDVSGRTPPCNDVLAKDDALASSPIESSATLGSQHLLPLQHRAGCSQQHSHSRVVMVTAGPRLLGRARPSCDPLSKGDTSVSSPIESSVALVDVNASAVYQHATMLDSALQ